MLKIATIISILESKNLKHLATPKQLVQGFEPNPMSSLPFFLAFLTICAQSPLPYKFSVKLRNYRFLPNTA